MGGGGEVGGGGGGHKGWSKMVKDEGSKVMDRLHKGHTGRPERYIIQQQRGKN